MHNFCITSPLRWIILLFLFTNSSICKAQKFFGKGGNITDFQNEFQLDSFAVAVKGLPLQANNIFGISKVCVNITHPRVSDLKLELRSPDGTAIWLTNRNGGDNARNYADVCFRSNGFSGYIHRGVPPFIEGEYIPDGRFSFLNNGQNPNGKWTLLIRDLKKGEKGTLNYFSLEFEQNPTPNEALSPCSFENGVACKCPDGKSSCELLPDLVMVPKFTEFQLKEYPYDDPNYPGQLRFAASIANIGDGPMETYGKQEWVCGNLRADSTQKCPDGQYPRQLLYQRVYKKVGEKLVWVEHQAGTNYYDDKPGHDHYHVDDWVEFRLVKEILLKSKKKQRVVIAKGRKISFCLFDSGICNNSDSLCAINGVVYGQKNLVNYGLGNYTDCKSRMQGISVGGYDTYGLMYEGQYLQLPKGLRSGEYILEIEIDPLHIYKEKSRTNNLLRTFIKITKQEFVSKK